MIVPQLFALFGEIQKISNRKWVKLKEKYVKECGGEKNQPPRSMQWAFRMLTTTLPSSDLKKPRFWGKILNRLSIWRTRVNLIYIPLPWLRFLMNDNLSTLTSCHICLLFFKNVWPKLINLHDQTNDICSLVCAR